MTAKKVFGDIAEFNVVISVVIMIILFCLVANTEASVIKFILSGIGLTINIMKKKTIDKKDEDAQNNVNWMITAFVAVAMYCTFGLFC